MTQERYMKSVLVQNFRSFYDELILLKHLALNDGSISAEEEASLEGNLSEKTSQSLAGKILNRLEKTLKAQYRLIEIQGGGYAARYYEEAQYVMVSLADEIFLNLPWKGKLEWQDNLLESRLYGTQDAGDKFFKNLETFLQGRDVSALDLAVIYLMGLGLGFQGKYRAENSASILNQYRQKLYDMITYDIPDGRREGLPLFEEAYMHTLDQRDSSEIINLRPWYLGWGLVGGFFLIVMVLIWFIETREILGLVKSFNMWIKNNAGTFN
ncbi:MAG: DotU family type IV/VI secretion system protein [Alphaproteobacteria bacterium]